MSPTNRPRLRRALKGSPGTSAITDTAVLIRHEGYACRLWVARVEDAHCVLKSLSESFVFMTSEPFQQVKSSTCFTFCVTHGAQLSPRKLESLLAAIPGVTLQVENSLEEGKQL